MHLYREFAPHPALAAHVACLWTSYSVPSARAQPFRVLPDNCIDILWQSTCPHGFAVGMMSRPIYVETEQPVLTLAVRFLPGAARTFLDLPLQELQDGRHLLADLWERADADALEDALWEHEQPVRTRLAIIERWLMARLRGSAATAPADQLVRQAVRLIDTQRGAVRIDDLARTLGVSRQHLALRFRERAGLNAKTFAMVSRFRHACAIAGARRGAGIDWAEVAATCGYYDQSHLINDFQLFAGQSPDAYARG